MYPFPIKSGVRLSFIHSVLQLFTFCNYSHFKFTVYNNLTMLQKCEESNNTNNYYSSFLSMLTAYESQNGRLTGKARKGESKTAITF